jgi:pimeloyl-ACP methyl ester carboxylesterase
MTSAPRLIIIIVHGTFSSRKRFAPRDSPLFRQCSGIPGARVLRFGWSGRNSHSARFGAAEKFAKFVLRLQVRFPATRFVIIAHSHGGNLVLRALQTDPEIFGRLAGVITLNTPFVTFTPRDHTTITEPIGCLFSIIRFTAWAITLLCFTFVMAQSTYPAWEHYRISHVLKYPKIAFCLWLFMLASVIQLSRLMNKIRRAALTAITEAKARFEFKGATGLPGRFVVMRSEGDEALLHLRAVSFITAVPYELYPAFEWMIKAAAFTIGAASTVLAFVDHALTTSASEGTHRSFPGAWSFLFWAMIIWGAAFVAVLVMSIPSLLVMSLRANRLGWGDRVVETIAMNVIANSTTTHGTEKVFRSALKGLRHSSIARDPQVLEEIRRYIVMWSGKNRSRSISEVRDHI